MAFTKFNDDLHIIAKLDDEPNDVGGLSADMLKAEFDKSGLLTKKFINETLIPEIESRGASNSGIAPVAGLEATNVQSALEELNGKISQAATGSIPDGAITAAKLSNGSITSDKFASGAVTSAAIADKAILDKHILSISASKINGLVVNTSQVKDGAVTGAKLADGTITSVKLADKSVTTAKLADKSVTTIKLADGAVTKEKLASGAVCLSFKEISVPSSAWAADTTYTSYGFRATVALSETAFGVDYMPDVIFAADDAASGSLAPVADLYDKGVYIYADSAPTAAITIPVVVLWRV